MLDLLKERNFRTVVVIDDDNAPPLIDSIDALATALVNSTPRKRRTLAEVEPFFKEGCGLAERAEGVDSESLQANVRAWLESTGENLNGDKLKLAADVLFQGSTGPTHEKLRKELHQAEVELRAFSFGEWQRTGHEVLGKAAADGRVLLLVDEINDKEPAVDLDGQRVIRDVLANAAGRLPYIDAIMVTSNCEPANELEQSHTLYQQISSLLTGTGIPPNFKKVFVLSKARLDDHSFVGSFTLHLNRIEASRLSIELADATKEVLTTAVQDSLDWLKRIPLMEFHHSVFVTAQMEGAAEIDTLVRLATIRQRAALERLLREDKTVQTRIEGMRRFTANGFGEDTPSASNSALKELREQEFERPGSHVNLLRVPLACGDVFRFKTEDSKGTAHEFTAMLMGNPCDLVLRPDGKRKLTTGLLVQVKKVSNAQAEELAKQENSTSPLLYRLATGSKPEDTVYLFYNSRIESVPLHLLDLCWTNEDGIAKLVPQEIRESLCFLPGPQRARLESLSSRANEKRFAHLELWGTDLKVTVGDVGAQQVGNIQLGAKVEYPVAREWRLASEYASAALSALSQAISRPAFGHDYLQH